MSASFLLCLQTSAESAPPQSAADYDGHELWLRYVPVNDSALLAEYRNIVTSIIVDESLAVDLYRFADSALYAQAYNAAGIQQAPGSTEVVPKTRLAAARMELVRGLGGLLDKDIPVVNAVTANGAVIVGTPASSSIIAGLNLGAALADVGDEGYIIKSVTINGFSATVIAANTEMGAVYGTFGFLRMIQTREKVSGLDITEKPRVNRRRFNSWNREQMHSGNGSYRGTSGLNGESGDMFNFDLTPAPTVGNSPHASPPSIRLPIILDRYVIFARACASIGINEFTINLVNTNSSFMTEYVIRQTAAVADVLRPYGVKVGMAINYGQPTMALCNQNGTTQYTNSGITITAPEDETRVIGAAPTVANPWTANPFNPAYQKWWLDKTVQILKRIPDFCGYTVKANSEGQSGPQNYGFSHDEGVYGMAVLLQSVDVPAGIDVGTGLSTGSPAQTGLSIPVYWRSFVYNANVDNDRLCRAYLEFGPPDDAFGEWDDVNNRPQGFLPNVFIQTKNGPLDFQPREPFHPMFGRMLNTNQAVEFQITQEYTGENQYLSYLGTMWEEVLKSDTYANGPGTLVGHILDGSAQGQADTAFVGVYNFGNSANLVGHHFSASNSYAFGRLAWNWELTAKEIAEEWVRMTWSNDEAVVEEIVDMMMGSREAIVSFQSPLGLMHQFGGAAGHYSPAPQDYSSQDDWGPVYYNKATIHGLGWDRTVQGRIDQGLAAPRPGTVDEKYFPLVNQYYPEVRDKFANFDTCPEEFLATFHHVPWDHIMASGLTFWEELVYRYQMGVQYFSALMDRWDALQPSIDARRFSEVKSRLRASEADAARWRDESVNYWMHHNRLEMPVDKQPLSVKVVVAGKEYGGFNLSNYINPGTQMPNQGTGATYRSYTIGVPFGTTNFDITNVITLSDDVDVVIKKQATSITDTAQITVTKRDFFGDIKQDYTFTFAYDTSLADIKVNGCSLTSFKPTKLAYNAFGLAAPVVTAVTGDPAATAVVTNATSVPGAATIVVSNNGAPTRTYTVNFGKTLDSYDDFSSPTLDPKWSWVREDATNWSLTKNPGAMTITTQGGTIQGATNTARNILLQDAPGGDWMIESKVNLSRQQAVNNEEVGIIAYIDDSNYVAVGWTRVTAPSTFPANYNNIVFYREQGGTATRILHSGIDVNRYAGPNRDQIWFRLAKYGNQYFGYYSLDGVHFKTAKFYASTGTTNPAAQTLTNPITKVGVYTWNQAAALGTNPPLDVMFDYFRVVPAGELLAGAGFSARVDGTGTGVNEKAIVSLAGSDTLTGVFLVAVYKNGYLVACEQKEFGPGKYTAEFPIDYMYLSGDYTIKAFAWDDLFIPLDGAIKLR